MKISTKKLLPHRLHPGDTIGIACPSSPVDENTIYQGISILRSMGFQVRIDENLFEQKGYLAGSDINRATHLMNLFLDPDIKGIICGRGGYGSMRILPYLNYDIFENHAKILMGFSDSTALLGALYQKCGLITFHGPLITTMASSSKESLYAMSQILTQDKPIQITISTADIIKIGCVDGIVVGGNLSTLCHLLGTPFFPDLQNKILVIEDKGESCYRIDRMLTQMKLAGCFEQLGGMVLGSFESCGPVSDIKALVDEIFTSYQFPIVADFPIGHGEDNLSFPIGMEATLDTNQKTLYYHCPCVI